MFRVDIELDIFQKDNDDVFTEGAATSDASSRKSKGRSNSVIDSIGNCEWSFAIPGGNSTTRSKSTSAVDVRTLAIT